MSHNAIARVLSARPKGELSTAIVTRYFRAGGPIPTPRVLAEIARAIDTPWPVAFLHAGHLRELLVAVNLIARHASASELSDALKKNLTREAIRSVLVIFPQRDAAWIPLRNDWEGFLWTLHAGFGSNEEGIVETLSAQKLPHLLARAADALGDAQLSAERRRAVAAEYVNAWADEHDPKLAATLRRGWQMASTVVTESLSWEQQRALAVPAHRLRPDADLVRGDAKRKKKARLT